MHKGARFFFVNGHREGSEVLITREAFFIGRSRNNNLVLDDRSVSRKHAVLNLAQGQYILSDLNSFKGTYLNGQKIKEAVLSNGDDILIGTTILKFLTEGNIPMPRKKKRLMFFIVIAVALAGLGALIFREGGEKDSTTKKIEFYYSQGLKCYNYDKDISCARINWKKVLDIDPAGVTEHARKAKVLLNSLSSNAGGEVSR